VAEAPGAVGAAPAEQVADEPALPGREVERLPLERALYVPAVLLDEKRDLARRRLIVGIPLT
jgi:hypothetical protein